MNNHVSFNNSNSSNLQYICLVCNQNSLYIENYEFSCSQCNQITVYCVFCRKAVKVLLDDKAFKCGYCKELVKIASLIQNLPTVNQNIKGINSLNLGVCDSNEEEYSNSVIYDPSIMNYVNISNNNVKTNSSAFVSNRVNKVNVNTNFNSTSKNNKKFYDTNQNNDYNSNNYNNNDWKNLFNECYNHSIQNNIGNGSYLSNCPIYKPNKNNLNSLLSNTGNNSNNLKTDRSNSNKNINNSNPYFISNLIRSKSKEKQNKTNTNNNDDMHIINNSLSVNNNCSNPEKRNNCNRKTNTALSECCNANNSNNNTNNIYTPEKSTFFDLSNFKSNEKENINSQNNYNNDLNENNLINFNDVSTISNINIASKCSVLGNEELIKMNEKIYSHYLQKNNSSNNNNTPINRHSNSYLNTNNNNNNNSSYFNMNNNSKTTTHSNLFSNPQSLAKCISNDDISKGDYLINNNHDYSLLCNNRNNNKNINNTNKGLPISKLLKGKNGNNIGTINNISILNLTNNGNHDYHNNNISLNNDIVDIDKMSICNYSYTSRRENSNTSKYCNYYLY